MKMWIARDQDGLLNLFQDTKPKKKIYEGIVIWEGDSDYTLSLDKTLFPEVTFENSPQQVEIKLIRDEKRTDKNK